jgi:hypothetical protein
MTLKMILFIILVVFIAGSLGLALWYRMNDEESD